MTKLPPDKLRKIVRDYVTKGWDFDPVVKDPHDVDHQYELTEDRIAELKEELVYNWNNRGRIVSRPGANGELVSKTWIEWLIEDHNLQSMDENSKTLFAREMVKAEIELLKIRLERLKGNYDARQLDEALTALGLQSPTPSGTSIGSLPQHLVAQPEVTSIALSELIADYWEDRVSTWKTRTIVEYTKVKSHLLEHLGPETPVHTFTYDRMKEYRQILLDQKLSASRISLYVGFINSVFKHGVKTQRMQVNPAEGLKIRDARKKHTLRDAFSDDELKLIFESKLYQGEGFSDPYKFWLPLLALFTGCRLEELCQLRASQVIQEEGIWCLRIAKDYPDQSVKTSEHRTAPLHPFLIDRLGFQLFAQSKQPDDRLFSELKRINNRWGHYAGRDFTSFKKKCGITNQKVTFHSFRHLMETTLQGMEADQRLIDQLLGHSVRAEHARYGKPNIPLIYEKCICPLPWPEKLDLDKIKSRWGGNAEG